MTRYGVGMVFFALALSVGSVLAAEEKGEPVDLRVEPILAPPWLVEVRAGDLYARSSRGAQSLQRLHAAKDGAIRDIAVAQHGDSSLIAWLAASAGGQRLLAIETAADSSLPEPTEIASSISSNAVRVASDGKGRSCVLDASLGANAAVHVTPWSHESNSPVGERIALDLAGIESVDLFSAVLTEGRLSLFVTSSKDGSSVISALTYRGPSFEREGPPKRVGEADQIIFTEPVPRSEKATIVFKYQRDGSLGLSLASESERGWESSEIPNAHGMDVARAVGSAWSDGRVLVVLSGQGANDLKQRISAAASDDGGKHWDFQRIDTAKGSATRAWLPDLATAGDQVAVVWEDSRDIRSTVRMQLSRDRGQRWLGHDILLSDEKHFALRPRIRSQQGSLYAAWYQFRTDARKKADGMLIREAWSDAFSRAQQSIPRDSAEDKQRALRQSVNAYWNALQEGDLQRAYAHHDPFFRARMPFDAFAARRGQFVYHSHEIRSIEVNGNVARVHSTVNFEIPKLIVMGREQSVPRRDSPIEDLWLYVDGGWYRQYVDPLSGGSAVKY